jgi:hypothetical protein
MKKLIFVIMLAALSVAGMATTTKHGTIPKGYTMLSKTMAFTAADSLIGNGGFHILTSDSLVILITNPQQYLQYQTFTTSLAYCSGAHAVTIKAYGKVTSGDSWHPIGSAVSWTGTSDNPGIITGSTAKNYNYFRVSYVASGATQCVKITAFEIKTVNVFPQGSFTATSVIASTSTTPLSFTSRSMTKGIDFGSSRLVGGAANAAFAYGTWSTPVYVVALAGHYVPIQVNLHTSKSAAYDVAAARFRVDADADTVCTLTAINVIEGRSDLYGTIAGHAGFNMSTNLAGNVSCTGDLIPILAKIQGTGNVTSSNQVYPFESTVTATGTGILGIGYFDANGCSVVDGIKVETHNSATLTNMLKLINSSGIVTNGIYLSGTLTHDIRLQNGAYIDNTTNGSLILPNLIRKHTPAVFNSTGTLSAANMLAGVVQCTSTSAVTMTTPTATAIAALIPGCAEGTAFDLIIDNYNSSSSGAVTLALDGSITVVNPAIITGGATLTLAVATTAKFSFYFTSATTAKCYRVY